MDAKKVKPLPKLEALHSLHVECGGPEGVTLCVADQVPGDYDRFVRKVTGNYPTRKEIKQPYRSYNRDISQLVDQATHDAEPCEECTQALNEYREKRRVRAEVIGRAKKAGIPVDIVLDARNTGVLPSGLIAEYDPDRTGLVLELIDADDNARGAPTSCRHMNNNFSVSNRGRFYFGMKDPNDYQYTRGQHPQKIYNNGMNWSWVHKVSQPPVTL